MPNTDLEQIVEKVKGASVSGYSQTSSHSYSSSYQSSRDKISDNPQYDAEGLFQKGKMFDVGSGVGKDKKRAFEYYKQAAEMGHPKAQFNLAQLYEFGNGVGMDIDMAKYWYKKAANQGLEEAKCYLVRL